MAKQPNQPKPHGGATRRETIEAMRRQQKTSERRKTLLVVGVASVLGLALIAIAVVPALLSARNDPLKKEVASFGVSASAADCGDVIVDPATGIQDHVQPGTTVDYSTVPPSSGKHYPAPAGFGRNFYTAEDRPPVEQLVHNLEHGYTILWYTEDASDDELATLRDLSRRVSREPATAGKFIVSAWDDSYGTFPEGKHFALSHWGGDQRGYRQLCGELSGEVVESFIKAHPSTNAPEPQGV